MSLATLAGHHGSRPALPRPHPSDRRPALTGIPDVAPLNLTIEMVLPLANSPQGLIAALEALNRAVRAVSGGTLRVHGGGTAALAAAGESPAAAPRLGTSPDDRKVRILPEERTVWLGAREVHLSRLEFDLLLFFARHPQQAFTRRQLLESVWGYTQATPRTVDVHVRRLRAKLGESGPLLVSIRGIGYRLDSEAKLAICHSYPG